MYIANVHIWKYYPLVVAMSEKHTKVAAQLPDSQRERDYDDQLPQAIVGQQRIVAIAIIAMYYWPGQPEPASHTAEKVEAQQHEMRAPGQPEAAAKQQQQDGQHQSVDVHVRIPKLIVCEQRARVEAEENSAKGEKHRAENPVQLCHISQTEIYARIKISQFVEKVLKYQTMFLVRCLYEYKNS